LQFCRHGHGKTDAAPGRDIAGHRDHADQRMRDGRCANIGAIASDDVYETLGEELGTDFGQVFE
jgi:hypothetical protein